MNIKYFSSVFCLGLGSVAAGSSLLTNGSFETPSVPLAGQNSFNTGSTGITGWTVVGPQVSIVSGSTTQRGFRLSAEDGTQWLDLTGNGANSLLDGVTQTVSTVVGTRYILSYFVGNIIDPGGPLGTSSTVDTYVSGALIQTAVNAGGGTSMNWKQFQISFVAASSLTGLEFLNSDPANDNLNGLDNVAITPAAPTVPEPSTLEFIIIVALGFGGYLSLNRSSRIIVVGNPSVLKAFEQIRLRLGRE